MGPVDDPLADGHAAVLLLRRPRSVDLRLGHPVGNVPEIPRPGTKTKFRMKVADEVTFFYSQGVQVLLADAQPAARQDSRRRLPL